MSSDKAPAPFDTDFYVNDQEEGVRGSVLHAERIFDVKAAHQPLAAKIPHAFAAKILAPPVPSDPMYVFPRSRFHINESVSAPSVANTILTALQGLCPQGCQLSTDSHRVKISVLIPGTLDFKIKLFQCEDRRLLVVVRRDSGDWFMFMQLYSAIKKHLRTQFGLIVESA
jgi:hypothetical protein